MPICLRIVQAALHFKNRHEQLRQRLYGVQSWKYLQLGSLPKRTLGPSRPSPCIILPIHLHSCFRACFFWIQIPCISSLLGALFPPLHNTYASTIVLAPSSSFCSGIVVRKPKFHSGYCHLLFVCPLASPSLPFLRLPLPICYGGLIILLS